jgi:hypothetical protein
MRAIVDLVDSITGLWTRTIRLLVLGGIAIAAIFMLMISVTAPAVVENVGDRAERISDKAIEAAREEARATALAEDGWGYSDANAGATDSAATNFSDGGGGDWGAASE